MKKTKAIVRLFSFVLSFLLCAPLTSCTANQKKQSQTYFDYFDTVCTITAYDTHKGFDQCNLIFKSELEKYHKLFDVYNTYDGITNLCTLNESAGGEPIAVSDELFDFLQKAKELHTLTNGYTSISIGAVSSVWKKAISDKAVPNENELLVAAKHTDISSLELDRQALTARIAAPNARLDAGALAKGYASDKIREALIASGCDSFLIDLGGNLTAHGTKPNGNDFTGAVENPLTHTALNTTVSLTDRTLSTSGSYNRGFEADGIRYHHIIDPYTMMPSNLYVSVSVLCADGITADALSTALFSMSYEDGEALITRLENAEAVWIFADGTVKSTSSITVN
jgi:thiamine biosynthesis lipoprotein